MFFFHVVCLRLHVTIGDDRRGVAGMADFKIYLLRQFCSNRVEFFTVHRRRRRKKRMDQKFEIRFKWFLRILEILKKALRGPSATDLAIVVAAKLHVDQSMVLVTKFHQNQSTLKGRSAGQRHTERQTDSQTNSAENNGPSGLQSGQLFSYAQYRVALCSCTIS